MERTLDHDLGQLVRLNEMSAPARLEWLITELKAELYRLPSEQFERSPVLRRLGMCMNAGSVKRILAFRKDPALAEFPSIQRTIERYDVEFLAQSTQDRLTNDIVR